MSAFPSYPFPLNPSRLIPPLHAPFIGPLAGRIAARANAAWPTANKAIFIPFRINELMRLQSPAVVNGGTVSGNIDGGIYTEDGVRIVSSGSLAQSGTNATQSLTIANFNLLPGSYYFAVAMDNTTGTLGRFAAGNVASLRAIGVKQQTTAFPLPATATFAAISSDYVPTFFLSASSLERGTITLGHGENQALNALDTIHTMSWEAVGGSILSRGQIVSGAGSAAWTGANWGCLIPFTLSRRTSFQRIFLFNGSVVSGNIDLGIYDANRNRLFSTGSTAQSGTDTLQVLNLSFTLGPGRYNMAVAVSNTTAQVIRFNPSGDDFGFIASETMWGDTSFPLPATFTINQFPVYAPFMGIAKGTVI
jgi:hypothetical protein